jgi:hypothetical protein
MGFLQRKSLIIGGGRILLQNGKKAKIKMQKSK